MGADGQVQIVGGGANEPYITQIDPTFLAQRTSLKPLEFNPTGGLLGGHHSICVNFSNTAAKPAAASDVFSLRWSDTTWLFVLLKLTLTVSTTTTYTASLIQDAALYKATGFTVAASAGTQVTAVLGSNQRMRMTMSPTKITTSGSGLLWISSGDLLTAGTRVIDSYPLGYMSWLNPITTVNAPSRYDLFDCSGNGHKHPIVLAANEGLVVQTPIGNAQAAGVSKWAFTMDWAEVTSF